MAHNVHVPQAFEVDPPNSGFRGRRNDPLSLIFSSGTSRESVEARRRTNDWLERLPNSAVPDVVGRLRARDDAHFIGAFLELYVHETAIRLGATGDAHPRMTTTTRKPDFRFRGGGRSALVEAKAINKSRADLADESRLNRLLDRIDDANTDRFALSITVVGQGVADASSGQLVRDLREWLATLDADRLTAEYRAKPGVVLDSSWPEQVFEQEGWFLRIRPRPPLGGETIASVVWEQGRAIDDVAPIRKRIREKSHRYGSIDEPYVIALDVGTVSSDTFAMNAALFGQPVLRISTTTGEAVDDRLPDGLLFKNGLPRNEQISGFLVTNAVRPWNSDSLIPDLWLNPSATHPLSCRPPHVRVHEVDPHGFLSVREPTVTPAEFFN